MRVFLARVIFLLYFRTKLCAMSNYIRLVDDRWSFREADTKQYTHCYHTYPAMMIPQVARTLIKEYKPEGKFDLIFDPYMGSGTTLVEACLAGVNSVGTDLNPLARLMSMVKSTHYDERELRLELSAIQSDLAFYNEALVHDCNFDRISNYTFWYTKANLIKLSYLQQLINEHCTEKNKNFFLLALSEVVREVSFTRNGEFKRYRMTEESIRKFNPDVFGLFERKVVRNIAGLQQFNRDANGAKASIYGFNSTLGIPEDILPAASVDMVVTSPPYGDSHTTVAYGQFSRWANEWFGYKEAASLDNLLMGGKRTKQENYVTTSIQGELEQIKSLDEKRYWEVVSFLNDYSASIACVAKTVRRGGVVCYVVGDRRVKNVQIPLDYFTAEMFTAHGFEHKITLVREIPNKRMPSKTSPTNVAGEQVATMSHEFIVIMQKC